MALSKTAEAYLGFLKISDKAYAEQVRYYEDSFSVFISLPDEEKLELELAYLNALFELGAYKKFLAKVDSIIPTLFDIETNMLQDQNALQKILFRKSCSYYQLFRNEEARKLAEQIIRMYPENREHRLLLQKIYRRQLEKETHSLKAISIGLYLLSGLCIAIYLFIIDPFYLQYKDLAELCWQGILGLATTCLIFTEGFIVYKSRQATYRALKA